MRTPKEKKKKLVISPDIMTLFDIEENSNFPLMPPTKNFAVNFIKSLLKKMFSLANLATLGTKKKT